MLKQIQSGLSILAAVVLLGGCATSHVMMGQARPPISPDQVTVYFHPPQTKYDEIAMIETSSKGSLGITQQGKTDVVIQRLKEEAAKLGANGILIQGIGDESGGSIGTGFGNAAISGSHAFGTSIGFSGNVTHKAGSGIAIYVEPTAASK